MEFWVYSSQFKRIVAVFDSIELADSYIKNSALHTSRTDSLTILQPIHEVKGLLDKYIED